MKVTMKTLGNKKFDLEDVSPSTTIKELKALIAADARFGGIVRKLIFKGKSLKADEQTLESCNIEEGSEIVCLVKKPKKGKSASPAPASDEKEASSDAPARDRNDYTINPADTENLCKMGFPHQLAELSLKAAYGDPALAAQYLMAGGIPAARAQALQKEMQDLQNLAAQQQRAKGPQGMNAQFEQMLSSPQEMAAIMSNPQVQQECLRVLGQTNPELLQRFSADPDKVGDTEEFQKAMFNILRKSFASQQGPRTRTVELTEQDGVNLKRLMDEKAVPDIEKAATIYIKFGKDIEKAMAFCDEMLSQAQVKIELTEQDQANLKRLMDEKAVPDKQKAATIYMKFGKDIEKAMEFCDELLAKARGMHPVAAKADAEKDAADARQPLQARNRSHSDDLNMGGPSSPTCAQDTVLSIPLNMLAEDDDSDEE